MIVGRSIKFGEYPPCQGLGFLVDIPREGIRYSLHQRMFDRHSLKGYYGYMVAREYYEERSLGIANGILRGMIELGISALWLGNILVTMVRGQLL